VEVLFAYTPRRPHSIIKMIAVFSQGWLLLQLCLTQAVVGSILIQLVVESILIQAVVGSQYSFITLARIFSFINVRPVNQVHSHQAGRPGPPVEAQKIHGRLPGTHQDFLLPLLPPRALHHEEPVLQIRPRLRRAQPRGRRVQEAVADRVRHH